MLAKHLDEVYSGSPDVISQFMDENAAGVLGAYRLLWEAMPITVDNVAAVCEAIKILEPYVLTDSGESAEDEEAGNEVNRKLSDAISEEITATVRNLYLSIQRAIVHRQLEAAAILLQNLQSLSHTEQFVKKIEKMYVLVNQVGEELDGQATIDPTLLNLRVREDVPYAPVLENSEQIIARVTQEVDTVQRLAQNAVQITEVAELLEQQGLLAETREHLALRLYRAVTDVANHCNSVVNRVHTALPEIKVADRSFKVSEDDPESWQGQLGAMHEAFQRIAKQLSDMLEKRQQQLQEIREKIARKSVKSEAKQSGWSVKELFQKRRAVQPTLYEDLPADARDIEQIIEQIESQRSLVAIEGWLPTFSDAVVAAVKLLLK